MIILYIYIKKKKWKMQGELVDRVESHVEQSRNYTEVGKKELQQASVYHAKARKVFLKLCSQSCQQIVLTKTSVLTK